MFMGDFNLLRCMRNVQFGNRCMTVEAFVNGLESGWNVLALVEESSYRCFVGSWDQSDLSSPPKSSRDLEDSSESDFSCGPKTISYILN